FVLKILCLDQGVWRKARLCGGSALRCGTGGVADNQLRIQKHMLRRTVGIDDHIHQDFGANPSGLPHRRPGGGINRFAVAVAQVGEIVIMDDQRKRLFPKFSKPAASSARRTPKPTMIDEASKSSGWALQGEHFRRR
ncbi:hypothetical protein C8029_10595, partial [Roseobacter sp. TSBP12]